MKYRPEIDGLRTIAVLPVVLFHAHLGLFPGGFIGVDIFFVISGYLITSLLIADIERGTFSLIRFYDRRARRILPALFLVMFACIPFAYIWMFPLELNDFAQSLVATTLFSSNILFWLESGYFSPDSELKPLLHTWSLAIEEQYYVLFPLLLMFLWRGPRRVLRVAIILCTITLASFAFAVLGSGAYPDATFYLLPARAWELLIGALCAIAIYHKTIRPHGGLSALGLLFILIGLIWADDVLWPSWMTLAPTVGAGLIILFASPTQPVGRLLASKPFVAIGLISYSAYLWHQPLLAFARLRVSQDLPVLISVALVLLTFVLAYMTWRFVEQPFRVHGGRPPKVSSKSVTVTFGLGALGVSLIALWGDVTDGFPDRKAPSGLTFETITQTVAGGRTVQLPCDTDIRQQAFHDEPLASCIFTAPEAVSNGKHMILIGDSHATVMSDEIRTIGLALGYDVSLMSFGGCSPFPGYRFADRDCHQANERLYSHLEETPYDVVMVAARSQFILGQDKPITFVDQSSVPADQGVRQLITDGIMRLLATGSQIVVLDPVPEMPVDIGQLVRKRYAFEQTIDDIEFVTSYNAYLDRAGDMLDILTSIESTTLIRVPSADLLCEAEADRCYGIRHGVALYTDDNHLSSHGIKVLAAQAREALMKL